MRKILALAIALSVISASSLVVAAPLAKVYPSGKIEIINDTAGALANATIQSPSGKLGNPSALANIPGAIADNSEFPFAFTYLNLPPGTHDTGNTAAPGLTAQTGDLFFEFRGASLLEPLQRGALQYIPEPGTLALAAFGLIGMLAASRRQD